MQMMRLQQEIYFVTDLYLLFQAAKRSKILKNKLVEHP
jgi:hypothetical protein